MMKWRRVDKIGVLLGFFTLCLHWFLPSAWMEIVHGKWLFPFFSWILDRTIGVLPFPFFYILLAFAFYLVYFLIRAFRDSYKRKWADSRNLILGILAGTGYLIAAFYFLWGFNYDRIQLQDRLTWKVQPVDNQMLMEEATQLVNRLGLMSDQDRMGIDQSLAYKHYRLLEMAIRREAVKLASELGYLGRDKVRCRQLLSGVLLRISTAGFYNPLSGECNIDRGLHPLQKPFSMAHEFFHGMGVTGEGDCNFLAYLLCHQSDHDFIRYSGELGYWRYMRRSVYLVDQDQYQSLVAQMPPWVEQDLKDIEIQMEKYPDIAPKMRDAIYGAYLRSNKIHDGLANYNRILQLVINWRQNGESF